MNRQHGFEVGEFYHLYNRGTEKREIFTSSVDYQRFLILLHLCNNTEVVHISNLVYQGLSLMELLNINTPERLTAIGAYCLMPNHFHLLVREEKEGGISVFMKKLLTGYAMYFNKKHQRTGTLFQGPFKAQHVDGDRYLKHLFAYIHLNPSKLINPRWPEAIPKSDIEEFLDRYTYSSYPEYCLDQARKEAVLLSRGAFPDYFNSVSEAREELYDWLDYTLIKDSP